MFCGTAAGTESARRRCYYAHPQNKFWRALHEVGLTDRLLDCSEFALLPQFGIGLTDIAKTASGMDKDLPADALGRAACASDGGEDPRLRAGDPRLHQPDRRSPLSAPRRRFRRTAGDDRRDPHLAAAVAVAGGELELGGQCEMVARARDGGRRALTTRLTPIDATAPGRRGADGRRSVAGGFAGVGAREAI